MLLMRAKRFQGMITPTQTEVIKETKNLRMLRFGNVFSGRLRSKAAGAQAVVGYVAMHNTYSNAKKYLLVVWNGWINRLQFLPYDVSIYTAHDGTYCKG